ncbi:carbohydrate-binding family 9-like protein [Paenibacillus alkaliterrae]|uniref:carbohydrate-binding family 9-like protein n=1 Tax=Paenibacillus alkaliterrae TaxID=320909 RepID=UPI001F26C82A|nr:carbohydrate-binding family 9-like protein [Paenibacillus alkaliterrae]MCF2939586.1 carbohydrate-binding family 9-like protein [Paenibacillus alkaliterrae]
METDALHADGVYYCKRARFTCEPDGSETVDWSFCDSMALTDTVTGLSPYEPTEVRACWSPDSLYVRFLCKDSYIVSGFTRRDDPLYEQDVVEMFIDEEGLGRHYLELEVSPRNVVFDAKIENDGVASITGTNKEWSFTGLQTNVEADGEGHFIYFIRIPSNNFKRKPEQGVSWKVNFYRIDEGKDGTRQYQAWQPTGAINYHIPSRFGTLAFV